MRGADRTEQATGYVRCSECGAFIDTRESTSDEQPTGWRGWIARSPIPEPVLWIVAGSVFGPALYVLMLINSDVVVAVGIFLLFMYGLLYVGLVWHRIVDFTRDAHLGQYHLIEIALFAANGLLFMLLRNLFG